MESSDFIRLHSIRAPNIGWFLGAGAAAAAGVPTALDMIWDFKRTLFCSNLRVSVRSVQDLSDPAVRRRIQEYVDSRGDLPKANSEDEYAALFEATHPTEADRRRYIDRAVRGRTPSFGHYGLAGLVKLGRLRALVTTNFDRLLEDALARVLGTTAAVDVATPDTSHSAMAALNDAARSLYLKLHGDFQSRRLKNISAELQTQDEELRRTLIECCRRYGLAVVGYSGRDQSVMDALEEAIDRGNGFPNGLFWFYRSDSPRMPRANALITKARSAGIQAAEVEAETFDELIADVLTLEGTLPDAVVRLLDQRAKRVRDEAVPRPAKSGWPVLRMNALPVVEVPSQVRRVVCGIGGTREVRAAVAAQGANVIACRSQRGVLAFGSDDDIKRCFEAFGITEFELHSIESRQLGRDTAEKGLLMEAIARALARTHSLDLRWARSGPRLLVKSDEAGGPRFKTLREAAGGLMVGTVPRTTLRWAECTRLRLDYRLERLWLIVEPTVFVERSEDSDAKEIAAEFRRERLATRYNRQWNRFLDAWVDLLAASGERLCALGVSSGIDAVFKLSKVTAFSRPSAR